MTTLYSELAERFRGEIEEIDPVVQKTLHAWERAQTPTTDQDIYLDAVALNLHGFCSGLERLFEGEVMKWSTPARGITPE